MELKEELENELGKLMEEFVGQELTKNMVIQMHMKLMLYGLQKFPATSPKQLNNLISQVIIDIVKPYIDGTKRHN